MSDIQNRPFSKDYSGLIAQSTIAVALAVMSVTLHEIMKRKRRGRHTQLDGLGGVESWQFSYLYQACSWARNPSPPTPMGWPLSWVKDSIVFPQEKLNELRGVDAALYVRFLRGCLLFVFVHTLTTAPILLPIHIRFSSNLISPHSMTRASISSLVETKNGHSLLWIHVCLLFWITLTWIGNLFYICNGAFKLRAAKIEAAVRNAATESDTTAEREEARYHPHPHPPYRFTDIPVLNTDQSSRNRGLRLRTVMVTNIPVHLRSEKDLKEYFEHHLSHSLDKPFVGLPASTQPGLLNKLLAFVFNRAKRMVSMSPRKAANESQEESDGVLLGRIPSTKPENISVIDRVVIARRMTELASLMEQREEVLHHLEAAHIRLAQNALLAVYDEVERRQSSGGSEGTETPGLTRSMTGDVESGHQMDLLVRTISPFLDNCELGSTFPLSRRKLIQKVKGIDVESKEDLDTPHETIWDALLSLPRSVLDPYQPLTHLSILFRRKAELSIDYYSAKLNLLTSSITQYRARAVAEFTAVPTAFISFKDPADARKACKYLAVHPNNPLVCLATMAPQYEDIDWKRVMKSTYRVGIFKDWVVNIGVWGFTLFWIFPVSLFVGFVSIGSISTLFPGLYNYLSSHPWHQEFIQSFLPTILFSLLMILVPLILLFISKKVDTIITLSAMHDRIMTRYYKFLIVNVLVFFCVGTAALQSFITSRTAVSGSVIMKTVANSFPMAGPFYVGWLIFTTAIHGSFELVMFGLPLFTYPFTKRQATPRKRAVGIRPRTFNFYYWLPNHLLVIHVLLLFALLNPLVVPFGLIYFSVETAVVKNQLLHVYARNYERNGQILLMHVIRYSLDGLMLAQFVFLAYMVVLWKTVNIALSAVLFVLTIITKIIMTRMCLTRFEKDDTREAQVICRTGTTVCVKSEDNLESGNISPDIIPGQTEDEADNIEDHPLRSRTRWLPAWVNFFSATVPRGLRPPPQRQQNQGLNTSFLQLHSVHENEPTASTQGQPSSAVILASSLHSPPAEGPCQPPLCISTCLVQRHPPLAAWDDEPCHNIPYDNPYYTKPITNALWLPRNPLGLLDLDDTVDVYSALTSEPGAGDVGHWFGPGFTTSTVF